MSACLILEISGLFESKSEWRDRIVHCNGLPTWTTPTHHDKSLHFAEAEIAPDIPVLMREGGIDPTRSHQGSEPKG